MTTIIETIKTARRCSVPLVAIQTPDPAHTINGICAAINGGSIKIQWDVVRGFRGMNEESESAVVDLVGQSDGSIGNPAEAMIMAQRLPKDTILFIHMANRWLEQSSFVQTTWNLRDEFKQNFRMCILLGPHFTLPAELTNDILLLDEPLPTPDELKAIVLDIASDADLMIDAEQVSKSVDAVQGLSAFPAEQACAMSLSKAGVRVDDLWERKRKLIEQTPALSVWREGERFDDIRGYDNVKGFLKRFIKGKRAPNAVVYLDEIEKALAGDGDTSGVSQDQLGCILSYMEDHMSAGCIFIGPPGCLSGDTVMSYMRGKRRAGRDISLRDLYCKFNGLPTGKKGSGNNVQWRKDTDTFLKSYDSETGRVFFNRIIGVTMTGQKACVKVSVAGGRTLVCTEDHPILTPTGYVEAGLLVPVDDVIVEGSMLPRKKAQKSPRKKRVEVSGIKYHATASTHAIVDKKSGKIYHHKREKRARLAVEASLNGLEYEEYIWKLRNDEDAVGLVTLDNGMEVHHINGETTDDRAGNLLVYEKADHSRLHASEDGKGVSHFDVEYTKLAAVEAVEPAGFEETYDIQMKSPHSNFCTQNGFIVHNSGKSAVAKATGNEAGIPTIALDLGGAKGSLVGQSEANIRAALKTITSVSSDKTLWIGTCNSIAKLPAALRRRFRQGTFFFDLPTAEERDLIWARYITKYELPGKESMNKPRDENWTGAEIRNCCELADSLGISLIDAAKYITPIAKSDPQGIETLRNECDGRYLSASYEGFYIKDRKVDVAGGKGRGRKVSLAD